MSDTKSPQNLSMDEILATIRRIIAEDEQSSGTPGNNAGSTAARGVPVAAPPAPVSPVPVSPAGVSDEHAAAAPRETVPASAEAAGADDVLELTDALNEDGSVRRLAPLATATGTPEPEPARTPPMSEPARTPRFAERAAETMAIETSPANVSPAEIRPADASPQTERAVDPGPAATPSGANDERLVSEGAASAAAAAFGHLASAPRARPDSPLVGDRPLDEIVRELLRPLLRSWLNENLPAIVERLVEAEIAKISARSEPG